MFDISVLKEMKLPELQEIAKATKKIKYNGVKKETLIYQILDYQAANPEVAEKLETIVPASDNKPKRARIHAEKQPAIQKKRDTNLFSESPEIPAVSEKQEQREPENVPAKPDVTTPDALPAQKERKLIKFNKNKIEKPDAPSRETLENKTPDAVAETAFGEEPFVNRQKQNPKQ